MRKPDKLQKEGHFLNVYIIIGLMLMFLSGCSTDYIQNNSSIKSLPGAGNEVNADTAQQLLETGLFEKYGFKVSVSNIKEHTASDVFGKNGYMADCNCEDGHFRAIVYYDKTIMDDYASVQFNGIVSETFESIIAESKFIENYEYHVQSTLSDKKYDKYEECEGLEINGSIVLNGEFTDDTASDIYNMVEKLASNQLYFTLDVTDNIGIKTIYLVHSEDIEIPSLSDIQRKIEI